ncbi:MAG TPA: hypothetical protein VFS18_03885, partial [Actinomycetota bacterium]|nr:hypothetical protein [Actinomycetota bacterium]
DIARYVATYTIEDSVPDDQADNVPEARMDERVFVGAFTTDYLTSLDLDRILSLGTGDFPEGDFSVEP